MIQRAAPVNFFRNRKRGSADFAVKLIIDNSAPLGYNNVYQKRSVSAFREFLPSAKERPYEKNAEGQSYTYADRCDLGRFVRLAARRNGIHKAEHL